MSAIERKIEILEKETMSSGFWTDAKKAKKISTELNLLKEDRRIFVNFSERLEKLKKDFLEVQSMKKAEDKKLFEFDLFEDLENFERDFSKEEIKIFFSSKFDKNHAIISIYSGAGGQDAQDWTSMLFSMYKKYAQKKKWGIKVLHQHFGEGSGTVGPIIKNITFEVLGRFAYGFLKRETGVHRLVRISPFSAQKLRHTSFSYIEVMPEVEELTGVNIKNEDLQISTFRSSGPGGQNVNKRDTAVRVKHIPTGITVSCQSERSQVKNKEKAIKIIFYKLLDQLKKQGKKEIEDLKGSKIEIEWGRQIRSYVLHPYKLVKDNRTKIESSQVEDVLLGSLDEFIEAEIKNLK